MSHYPIPRFLLLSVFFFFVSPNLSAQTSDFLLHLEQGIAALNGFSRQPDRGAFGGYAAALGGEYHLRSGLYLKADAQLISTRLEFYNRRGLQQGFTLTDIEFYNVIGLVNAREYRFSYGMGMATNWRKLRFALDLAHSIEFRQRAQTSILPDSSFHHLPSPIISRYGTVFAPYQRNLRLLNNSAHQLQLAGTILTELNPRISLGLFYRTDLLNRWVALQAEKNLGQGNFASVQQRQAKQAITGLRLTYQIRKKAP